MGEINDFWGHTWGIVPVTPFLTWQKIALLYKKNLYASN